MKAGFGDEGQPGQKEQEGDAPCRRYDSAHLVMMRHTEAIVPSGRSLP